MQDITIADPPRYCVRCDSSKRKDCFFTLGYTPSGNSLDKCTRCKRSGYKCDYSIDDTATQPSLPRLSGTPQSLNSSPLPFPIFEDSDEETTPSQPATLNVSSDKAIASAVFQASASCLPSTSPSVPCAQTVTPTVTTDPSRASACGKRKAGYDASNGSSPSKHRRMDDSSIRFPKIPKTEIKIKCEAPTTSAINKVSMLRQVSRLNISFETFNDLSLRQMESNRKRQQREAVLDERRLAFEESQSKFEEQKRIFEENMRISEEEKRIFEEFSDQVREENEGICAATQEWLAVKSESAGENLIEEATSLVTSIEQGPSLLAIGPAIQRLLSVFADFKQVQAGVSETQRFKGERAQCLYDLMECIRRASDGKINPENTQDQTAD
ncbi:hypothetical protein BDN70DRAFT_170913 [Pholiota conissans]|uniref:Uncharacterized protein n=1 Tax=Pholiota conissans TaxID=109636 RepID=A0A9P6CYB1_9AGAR|nr:hypothetical protein BDN70DRAFT_170913 [Pholiota conissans]